MIGLMRGKWVLISASVILVAIAAGALSVLRRESAPRPAPNPAAAPPAPLPSEVSLPGPIQAQHVISVRSPVAGTIDVVQAEPGQEVAEGQVLARIGNKGLETAREMATAASEAAQDRVSKLESAIVAARLEASRARADATRARGEYDRAERVYARQKMLQAEGATPRLVYEKSEREYQKAQAESGSLEQLAKQAEEQVQGLLEQWQNAKKILDDKNRQLDEAQQAAVAGEVRSPATGLVISRTGETAKEIEEGIELFRIATDLAALEVVLEPEPPVLARIAPGMPAFVVVSDVQSDGFAGSVKDIQGTQVLVDFTSPNPAIRPGMPAQVRLKFQ